MLDWDRLPDHTKWKGMELKVDERKSLSEGGSLVKFTEANSDLRDIARKRRLDV